MAIVVAFIVYAQWDHAQTVTEITQLRAAPGAADNAEWLHRQLTADGLEALDEWTQTSAGWERRYERAVATDPFQVDATATDAQCGLKLIPLGFERERDPIFGVVPIGPASPIGRKEFKKLTERIQHAR